MRVAGLKLDGNNRQIIDSVYRPAATAEFRELFDDPGSWIHGFVTMSRSNYHMYRQAALIAYIHHRTHALVASVVNLLSDEPVYDDERMRSLPPVEVTASVSAELTDELRNVAVYRLNNIFHCTPNQGFWVAGAGDRVFSCDQYRLCPWCRYQKALHIFDELFAVMNSEEAYARDVCVTHFMNICDPMYFSLNNPAKAYAKVVRSVGDKRDWLGDYVVTLPRQIRSDACEDDTAIYELVWRTSLIAITEDGFELPLPEALASKKIDGANFISDGIVYRYPGVPDGLSDAFATVMGYPKFMLSDKLTDEVLGVILTVLSAGDCNRAVPHGLRGDAVAPAAQTD